MQRQVLTAKSFLKCPAQREKYECMICYQVCMKPVRCRGSCGRIFCMKCVSDTRNTLDRCPSRCSSPFLVTPIPPIQAHFYCPYNPTQCPTPIASLAAFDQHYRTCLFVSPEEVDDKRLQQEYRCRKGHHLQFFVGSYEEMVSSNCALCSEQKLCRSFCRICETFYCVGCRIPPCSKEGCPIGHAFTFQRTAALNYICDLCGISTAVSNDGVYDDTLCNFGICEGCYLQLPPAFDQSKPRAIIANIHTECACSHTLHMVNSVHRRMPCALCRKNKQCPKECPNCHLAYCIACKLVDIYVDGTCRWDHEIVKVERVQFERFVAEEGEFGCMKCGAASETYYFDRECWVRLCGGCYEYSMKVTTDKERPVSLTCEQNHVLAYLSGPEDYEDNCCRCLKLKSIKLVCQFCEDGRMYCFECRPIPLQTCYFRHKLKKVSLQQERECHVCRGSFKEFLHCRKCCFFVCENCVELSLNNEQNMAEERIPSSAHQPHEPQRAEMEEE